MKILEVENLSKHYGNFRALDGLSFAVNKGEIFGMLGPNGAGKSTTMRCLLTLIKPTHYDKLAIFDKELQPNRSAILNRIGYLIEKPDFYPYLSGYNNLKLLSHYYFDKIEDKTIRDLIRKVGLEGRENDAVKKYSHGMKQRLGLAQALLNNPDLIILDEPNTGLDPQGIVELREFIVELKNEGKTVILSSHILNEIELIADSMVIINKGKAIAQGSISELLGDNRLTVKLEVANPSECRNQLLQSGWASKLVGGNEDIITVSASKQEIPELVSFVAAQGAEVLSVNYQKRLEELYMNLTRNTHAATN